MKTASILITGEECCDECREIVYNYFTCPSCEGNHNIDYYGPLWEEDTDEVVCEGCGTRFRKINPADSWYGAKVEVEVLEKK